ncbi:hypothetical protein Bhyg_11661 [Pseudolycoriella hygida]|uniref:Uncharacterized protein n=1 Tax=Pseudolycoriella hygida TaxID=35572 RepID=A0A9Q0S0G4_9DIPT|nr:hypothetical protein Bhyg_11661 [Pseudolycoriella hygida]
MKCLIVFAAIAVLGIVNAQCLQQGNKKNCVKTNTCPEYPVNVLCKRDPCDDNPCGSDELCCPNYSEGCNYNCVLKYICPYYPPKIQCFANPCDMNPCRANDVCCADYSKGCNRHCFPIPK